MPTRPSCRACAVTGVDMHIGSQITELAPFDDAFALLSDFVRTLRADGHAISHVDLGGGLGIPYREDNEPPPHPDAYAAMVKRATRDLGCRLIFEPGRLIVGNAGILVTRVLYLKRGEAKTFVIVDAGDERSDPPDAVRGPPRHPAGARAAAGRGAHAAPMWSGRSANPAISSRSTATWSQPQAGRSARGHDGRAPMARSRPAPTIPARWCRKCLFAKREWALVRPRVEVDDLIALDRLPPWL